MNIERFQAPIFEIPIVQQESQHGRVSREDNLTQYVSNQYQLGLCMRKRTIWVFDQVNQSQKIARSLKFWMKEEEGLYFPCSENKGDD